ncbi:hypothetical protein PTKIN_Ptkin17bG0099100 [Pterospermum kingtungense]
MEILFSVTDIDYFSALSSKEGNNFSVKESIYLALFEPESGYHKLALWNPSTRELKFLLDVPYVGVPYPRCIRPPYDGIDYKFDFNGVGFGFNFISEDYKAVRFIMDNFWDSYLRDAYVRVCLYSLKSDSWKKISAPYPSPVYSWSYIHMNGYYYWFENTCVVSFDFAHEKFSTLPLPKVGEPCFFDLIDFNGSLGAVVYPFEGTEKSFELWVMNESWTREFIVGPLPGIKRPLGFGKMVNCFLLAQILKLCCLIPQAKSLRILVSNLYRN